MPATSTTIDQEDAAATEAGTLSNIYAFLALTMRYPQAAFVTPPFLDTLESLLASLDWQPALAEVGQWRQQPINHLDDLQTEYTRMFINAAPRMAVPPYASVYLDGDGCLYGRTTEKTRDFYRQAGYDLTDETEPADHISHELDFLAALTGEGRYSDEELFLQTLFRPWFERFQEKSMKEARHPFYKASIQLIDFFTKEEQ